MIGWKLLIINEVSRNDFGRLKTQKKESLQFIYVESISVIHSRLQQKGAQERFVFQLKEAKKKCYAFKSTRIHGESKRWSEKFTCKIHLRSEPTEFIDILSHNIVLPSNFLRNTHTILKTKIPLQNKIVHRCSVWPSSSKHFRTRPNFHYETLIPIRLHVRNCIP